MFSLREKARVFGTLSGLIVNQGMRASSFLCAGNDV